MAADKKATPKKPQAGKPAQPSTIEGEAEEVKKKPRTSPIDFARQVRDEFRKVTWTTRNEAMISSVMVLIMVFVMAIFFFIVDQSLRFAVCSMIDCAAPTR